MTGPRDQPVGTCCVVLHSHLPWVAHAGAWPVGEEWLHSAWAGAYLPVVELLTRLAAEGRTGLLTLGVTPVLAAMLDDPYCLAEFRTWLGGWQARAEGALADGVGTASYEGRLASRALAELEGRWSAGASPVLRALADSGAVELLGGPATHPFTPLLHERVAAAQLAVGLDDAALRLGRRPPGIWAPECAYRPGLERLYSDAGVGHFLVDGPTVDGDTGRAYDVSGSGVVAFARDLGVTYRVWSPSAGYPGGPDYRDFHTFDYRHGLRTSRVTGVEVPSTDKAPYDPAAGRHAAHRDAADFVGVVRARLEQLREQRDGRPGLVVVAYDTELFGHWWHEGPAFLEAVLRGLPEAGVHLATLTGALGRGAVEATADLPAGSWGLGKDWHVWDGDQVRDLGELGADVSRRLLDVVDKLGSAGHIDTLGSAGDIDRFGSRAAARDECLDQLTREAFLTVASDWAFSVSHDSAAGYARDRAYGHALRFARLADALETHDRETAVRLTTDLRTVDGPFGHLDARVLRDPHLCDPNR